MGKQAEEVIGNLHRCEIPETNREVEKDKNRSEEQENGEIGNELGNRLAHDGGGDNQSLILEEGGVNMVQQQGGVDEGLDTRVRFDGCDLVMKEKPQ